MTVTDPVRIDAELLRHEQRIDDQQLRHVLPPTRTHDLRLLEPAARIHYGTSMDDKAVIVFASFRPIAGKETELQELLVWMIGHTRAEPGCERYDLYRAEGGGPTFHLFERYRDREALEAHRAAEYFLEYRRKVADLLDEPIEVLVLDALDAT